MSLEKAKQRKANSRMEALVHHFGVDVVQGIRELLCEESPDEAMVLNVHEVMNKQCHHGLHLVFNDLEGNECGEFNDSHPCPPFPIETCQ